MTVFREYEDSARRDVAVLLPQRYSRVLEVGCAQGGFSANLRKAAETWGVELNPTAAAIAATRFNRVIVGEYFSVAAQIPDRYFDLVICNDVVEHISDHMAFLRSLSDKMADDGILIISIPNVRCAAVLFEILVRRDWRYQSSGLLDYTHVRFFTRKSIVRSLRESGFSINRVVGKSAYRNSLIKRIAVTLFGVLTFGFFSDIRYVQFLIQARKSI